jgi:hypothetical protein
MILSYDKKEEGKDYNTNSIFETIKKWEKVCTYDGSCHAYPP